MTYSRLRRAAGPLLLCLAAACDPGPETANSPSLPPGTWSLAPTPQLRIGTEGADGHELDRVYGGMILADGSVLIGNSGTGELRAFDPSGRLALTAGRQGRGPREFQGINAVYPYRGDSLLVHDMRARQFSVWTQAGSFGRAFRLPMEAGGARPIGVFADGSIAVAAENQSDPRERPGAVREAVTVSVVTPAGAPVQTIGRYPGAEWLLYRHSQGFRATQVPLGQRGFFAVSGEHVVHATSESPRISLLDRAGKVVRTVDVRAPARKPSREDVDAALAEVQDREERAQLRRHLDGAPGAGTGAVLTDLRVDERGNLWVRTSEEAGGLSRWIVLAPSGEEIGSVVMPASYMPLDIRNDRILVRETDGEGVQRVSVWNLVR